MGPTNLRVLLTVNHVAAELLRLVRTSQSDTMELPGEGTSSVALLIKFADRNPQENKEQEQLCREVSNEPLTLSRRG